MTAYLTTLLEHLVDRAVRMDRARIMGIQRTCDRAIRSRAQTRRRVVVVGGEVRRG